MTEKYQMVWPDIEEKIISDYKHKMVYLEEDKSKRIIGAIDEDNYLIQGDNYRSLVALTSIYKEKIDFIYIDPPYNTGGRDFVYNDKFVDITDHWRHSKWLSFMHKRLFLAKQLLKDTGVIFISIDDREMGNLRCLCDKVFGEENRINRGMIIWSIPGSPRNFDYIIKSHEYILAYCKDFSSLRNLFRENYPKYTREISGSAVMTPSPRNPPDTICFKAGTRVDSLDGEIKEKAGNGKTALKIEEGKIVIKDGKLLYDVHLTGAFQINTLIRKYYENIAIGEKTFDRKGQEIIEIYLDKMGSPIYRKAKNTEIISSLPKDLPTSGVNDLKKILPDVSFNNPKPVKLIKELLKYFCPRDNGLVLDFFAGSGTTGQAVLELNDKDTGSRKFILCTNNENNICTDICYPRIKKVIEGYTMKNGKSVSGIPANLVYQKVEITTEEYQGGKSEVLLDKNKKKVGSYLKEFVKLKENTHMEIKSDYDGCLELFCRDDEFDKIILICYGFTEKFTPENLDAFIKKLPTKYKGNNINYSYYLPEEFGASDFIKYNYPDDIFNEVLIIKDITK